ncbi:hypothetical protein PBI_SCTP2_320 [Salicola phage SCTP-2]|nr:hypothetical protein PBI_SCTP2_320 [Salicola phage SCTP-2]
MYGPIIYFFLFGITIVMLLISIAITFIKTDKKTKDINKSTFIFVVCIRFYSLINFTLLGILDSEYNIHEYLLEQFNCEYNIEENEKCMLQFDVVKKE